MGHLLETNYSGTFAATDSNLVRALNPEAGGQAEPVNR